MPYKIGKQLLSELPPNEKATCEEVGQQLLDQAAGICYLCRGSLNPAAENLYADHIKPRAEGGKTEFSNLRLVHLACNSAKRNKRFEDVVPYLRLKRFMQDKGRQLKYGDVTEHFEIEPGDTQIVASGDNLHLEFCDGTSVDAPIIADLAGNETIRYAFVQVPRRAIFNDDLVQPRPIKLEHANSIFLDLAKNPLHEPPSCRTDPSDKGNLKRLRMFDGQHKTIASWMRDREYITIKLYLDMTASKANELVIAIQSRVKKLSLTPFESATKMAEEWRVRVAEYIEEMKESGKEADVSEAGYIAWLPADKPRKDGTTALKNALLQQVLDDKTFILKPLVDQPKKKVTGLSETMLNSSFLQKLLIMTPSEDPIAISDENRAKAVDNIVWMTNTFYTALTDDSGGEVPAEAIKMKRSRFFNQITLEQVADLLRTIFVRETKIGDKAELSVVLTKEARSAIEEQILWLASHPWWTASWERDNKMKNLSQAHTKNQNREKAFSGIAFDTGYAQMGPKYPPFVSLWKGKDDDEDDE